MTWIGVTRNLHRDARTRFGQVRNTTAVDKNRSAPVAPLTHPAVPYHGIWLGDAKLCFQKNALTFFENAFFANIFPQTCYSDCALRLRTHLGYALLGFWSIAFAHLGYAVSVRVLPHGFSAEGRFFLVLVFESFG